MGQARRAPRSGGGYFGDVQDRQGREEQDDLGGRRNNPERRAMRTPPASLQERDNDLRDMMAGRADPDLAREAAGRNKKDMARRADSRQEKFMAQLASAPNRGEETRGFEFGGSEENAQIPLGPTGMGLSFGPGRAGRDQYFGNMPVNTDYIPAQELAGANTRAMVDQQNQVFNQVQQEKNPVPGQELQAGLQSQRLRQDLKARRSAESKRVMPSIDEDYFSF